MIGTDITTKRAIQLGIRGYSFVQKVTNEYIPFLPTKEDTRYGAAMKCVRLGLKLLGETGFDYNQWYIDTHDLKVLNLKEETLAKRYLGRKFYTLGSTETELALNPGLTGTTILRTSTPYGIIYTVRGTLYQGPQFDWEGAETAFWLELGLVVQFSNPTQTLGLSSTTFSFKPYGDLKDLKLPHWGYTCDLISKVKDLHRSYTVEGVVRSYLFVGPPGTGKSTSILKVFEGLKILFITLKEDANNALSTDMVLGGLGIQVVVFEDLDRVRSSVHLLPTFEQLKAAGVTVVVTCNHVQNLPDALLRPGRLDQIVRFPPPNLEDRKAILRGYCGQFNLDVSEEDLSVICEASKDLSPAYLKEIALRMTRESTSEVVRIIQDMHELRAEQKQGKFSDYVE